MPNLGLDYHLNQSAVYGKLAILFSDPDVLEEVRNNTPLFIVPVQMAILEGDRFNEIGVSHGGLSDKLIDIIPQFLKFGHEMRESMPNYITNGEDVDLYLRRLPMAVSCCFLDYLKFTATDKNRKDIIPDEELVPSKVYPDQSLKIPVFNLIFSLHF